MPDNRDYAIAFALTVGAGMSTTIGAAIVFFPQLQTRSFLAKSLAFAAGVMLYVSFVEIYAKSYAEFVVYFDQKDNVNYENTTIEDYEPPATAYHCTVAIFFAGIVLTWILDRIVHTIKDYYGDEETPTSTGDDDVFATFDLHQEKMIDAEGDVEEGKGNVEEKPHDYHSLLKTALIAGTSIFLHNFPEGLATFIGAANDPSVGASLAIAIGIHNIPEGVIVSVPIYAATGKKWKAFFWGVLSGLAETVAGAIGWIAFATSGQDMGSLTYAILFGLVAGMMVYISFRELLPTAWRYDPKNTYTTAMLFLGFLVMAVSLMLFQI
eukprot:m.32524 g.32524  ORF g.32524 m.32524 type:complete len:323 (-) comp8423_c0_seq1:203-1171(-)